MRAITIPALITFPSKKNSRKTLFYGTFIHSHTITCLDVITEGAIGVGDDGKIAFIERGVGSVEAVYSRFPEWEDVRVVRAPEGGFFFPGFIGTFLKRLWEVNRS